MQFEKMIQIGIVIEDLQESIRQFEMFGFTGWQAMPFKSEFIPGMLLNGEPSDLEFNGAVCQAFGMEIELIQPISESAFMDFLREHGPGIHHLAFKPAEGYENYMQEYRELGYEHLIDVVDGSKTRGFTYLDTFKQLGFYAEIHRGKPGSPEDHKKETE